MVKKNELTAATEHSFFLYTDENGKVSIRAFLQDDTLWLTQKSMAEVFGVESNTITYHIKEIFKSEELREDSVTRKIRATADDGKSYNTNFYNLDMIIAVGYRVNSKKATQFRIWATQVLREYIVKGFAMDDARLKAVNNPFGKDYFREQLERIREIRTSERRLYQQLKDIYALSADYNQDQKETLFFFAKVQNKVHYAISGKTAAEIIYDRADGNKDNAGLTTWERAPGGRITKLDMEIAKNYLNEKESGDLRHIVSAFLEFAELQARNEQLIFMKDWLIQLDSFLTLAKKAISGGIGSVSREQAMQKAAAEYAKYRERMKPALMMQSEQELKDDIKALEDALKDEQ